jgi:hypothetical protein
MTKPKSKKPRAPHLRKKNRPVMHSVGSVRTINASFDNALPESFIKTPKYEGVA